MRDFNYRFEPPEPAEFVAFREACGWGVIEEEVAAAALNFSVIDVTCRSVEPSQSGQANWLQSELVSSVNCCAMPAKRR